MGGLLIFREMSVVIKVHRVNMVESGFLTLSDDDGDRWVVNENRRQEFSIVCIRGGTKYIGAGGHQSVVDRSVGVGLGRWEESVGCVHVVLRMPGWQTTPGCPLITEAEGCILSCVDHVKTLCRGMHVKKGDKFTTVYVSAGQDKHLQPAER